MEANQSPINSVFNDRYMRKIIFKINTDEIIEKRRKDENHKEICKIINKISADCDETGDPFYMIFFEIHYNEMPYAYHPETGRGLYL